MQKTHQNWHFFRRKNSNVVPEMEAHEERKEGISSVICSDLNAGKKLQSIPLPQDSLKHSIGDIRASPPVAPCLKKSWPLTG